MAATNGIDQGLTPDAGRYLTQFRFPDNPQAANPQHHILGLQSNTPSVVCNIFCDGMTLKSTGSYTLKLSFETSPVCSYILLELSLFPVSGNKMSAADHARSAREKVRVAFPTYGDDSTSGTRTRYPYTSNMGNTQPAGPHHFSESIHDLKYTSGDHQSTPRDALHPANYKPADQLHFSWQFKSCVKYSFSLAGKLQGDDKKKAVNQLEALLDRAMKNKAVFHVVARPSAMIKGIFYPWFLAMPNPTLPSYFPWLKKFDKADVGAIIELDSRGDPTVYKTYAHNALAVRGQKGWVTAALRDGLNFARPPEPYSMGTLPVITQFIDSRQYLAHVLVGYLLEDAFARRQDTVYANGTHTCQVCPEEMVNGLPRYIVLINIFVPAVTDAARACEDRGLPEVGEQVQIVITENNLLQTWHGVVQPMRPTMAQQYAANVLIVASPDPLTPVTGRVLGTYERSAEFTFGQRSGSTQPTINRLTTLMLDETEDNYTFWRKVLLAQDNLTMQGSPNDPKEALSKSYKAEIDRVCDLRKLNAQQKNVVRSYFTKRLTIVRGPPGTGKSTLIDTIVEIEHRFKHSLWVCADSNAAVDVLAEKACKRMGQLHPTYYLRIRKTFQETLDLERHDTKRKALIKTLEDPADESADLSQDDMARHIADIFDQSGQGERAMSLENMIKNRLKKVSEGELYKGEKADLKALQDTMDLFAFLKYQPDQAQQYDLDRQKLEKKMMRELREMQKKLIPHARVVFSTVSAANSSLLRTLKPRGLVMDEASQTLEAKAVSAIVHALAAGKLERVLLIGDDQQLPPTVVSNENPFLPTMQVSLFERLIRSRFPHYDLVEQYRMHPDISSIVNDTIYKQIPGHPGLINAPSTQAADQRFLGLVNFLAGKAGTKNFRAGHSLVIVPVNDPKCDWNTRRLRGSFSRFNMNTARMVVRIVQQATSVHHKYHPRDIMIICFYADQVRLLKSIFNQLDSSVVRDVDKLRIMTVDSSQGSEADMVIVDCVVMGAANKDGMGFLGQDQRRFNVAMSRAQKGRIVLGRPDMVPSTLETKTWKGFMEEARKRGNLMGGGFLNPETLFVTSQAVMNATFSSWIAKSAPFAASLDPGASSAPGSGTSSGLSHDNIRNNKTREQQAPGLGKKTLTFLFMDATGAKEADASIYLNLAGGNLHVALHQYYNDNPQDGDAEEIEVRRGSSSSARSASSVRAALSGLSISQPGSRVTSPQAARLTSPSVRSPAGTSGRSPSGY